jgi:hypothetical protein
LILSAGASIICGLYYKHSFDDSSIVNKFEASLIDDARVVIYNHHMFIVQASGFSLPLTESRISKKDFDFQVSSV